MRKSPVRYREHLALKAFALYAHGLSLEEIGKKIGIRKGTVHKWKKKVEKDPELLKKAKKIKIESSRRKRSSISDKIATAAALTEENEFLRWWNYGERKGFVKRLLQDLDLE